MFYLFYSYTYYSSGGLEEAMNSISRNQVCLKGNVVTEWPNNKSRNLMLRYVNL